MCAGVRGTWEPSTLAISWLCAPSLNPARDRTVCVCDYVSLRTAASLSFHKFAKNAGPASSLATILRSYKVRPSRASLTKL